MYIILQQKLIDFGWYILPIIQPFVLFVYNILHKYWFVKKPELIEPITSQWIMICSLISNQNHNHSNKYQLVNTDMTQESEQQEEDIIKKEYFSFYKLFYSNYTYSDTYTKTKTTEHLFIAKLNDNKYLCKVCFPSHVKYICDSKESDSKESITFLYVEYSHPKMITSILLPFPNEMLQPYNELFTPTFVLRQLQTQIEDYVFDMDYTLQILDSDLNIIHLNSNEYLIILSNKKNYQIINRK